MKGKMVLDDESLTVTARKFVEYLKEVKRKPILVGSDSEKSSPQSQNRVPAQVEATPLKKWLFYFSWCSYLLYNYQNK